MEKQEVGVRKGSWTKEEDELLTKCIQQFGEGRWHLVPPRAGLNRCRKSCRMRWLNYLKPNIKRGPFGEDEVDLIKKMHKLLGNRWSLIAGRLPGRTGNDVKNFWNSRFSKDSTTPKMAAEPSRDVVIKPRPRKLFSSAAATMLQPNEDENVSKNADIASSSSSQLVVEEEKIESNNDEWWRDLLDLSENGGDEMLPIPFPGEDDFINGFFADFDYGLNL